MYSDLEYLEYEGKGLILIRRAASITMKRTLNDTPHLHIKPRLPTYIFIRDPVDRIHSGFKFLPGCIPKCPLGMTYKEYVDQVLSGEPERHWVPQTDLVEGVENLTMYRFEDLETVWPTLGFPALKPHNISPDVEIPDWDYRIKELMEFYAEDYELRYGYCR